MNEWISVDERLPGYGDAIVAWDADVGAWFEAVHLKRNVHPFLSVCDNEALMNVTHWMQPEAPDAD